MILPETGLWQFAKTVGKRVSDNAVTDRAAQLSYYFVFALFPFLFTLVTLAAYLPVKDAVDQLMTRLDPLMPEAAMQIIRGQLTDLATRQRPHLLTFGLLLALWSASRGLDARVAARDGALAAAHLGLLDIRRELCKLRQDLRRNRRGHRADDLVLHQRLRVHPRRRGERGDRARLRGGKGARSARRGRSASAAGRAPQHRGAGRRQERRDRAEDAPPALVALAQVARLNRQSRPRATCLKSDIARGVGKRSPACWRAFPSPCIAGYATDEQMKRSPFPMPACSLEREVIGSTAVYRMNGRVEASWAWELAGRLEQEPLGDMVVDFSQVSEFVDYGVAIIAGALVGSRKRIELRGLRQHQERLFGYFRSEERRVGKAWT